MANLSFSFNKMKRSFFTVELKDGRKLVVKMPKKSTFEKMNALEELDTERTTVNDVMDTLGGVVAEFLSNNMNGEQITAAEITEGYDIEEMHELIEQYVAFTRSMSRNPN